MKRNFRYLPVAIVAASILIGNVPVIEAKTKTKRRTTQAKHSPNLQQEIEDLKQNQKVLERKWELDQEKAEAKEKEEAKNGVKVGVNSKEGFFIKSNDGQYTIKFRGLVQADARFFLKDGSQKLSDQFLVRRVRPIVEGTVTKYFDFRIVPDFGSGTITLQDAYGDIKPLGQWLKIRGGKFKVPVGLERLQSANNLFSIERGLPTNLVPNRDIGFELLGEPFGGTLQYAVGAFNGIPDNTSGGLNAFDGDNTDGKDFAGRLFVLPFKKTNIKPLQKFGFGFAGTYGSQFGTATATNLPSYKTIGQNTFFSYANGGAPNNTSVANGVRYRLSPQGYFYYGPFGLFGEYVRSTTGISLADGSNKSTLTHQAWQVAAEYFLTGEEDNWSGIKVKRPIHPKRGQWGAVTLGARYNEQRNDPRSFPVYASANSSAQRARAWGVVANWHLSDNFKLSLSYDQTHFKGGASGGGNRAAEHALFSRLQVNY